MKKIYFNEYSYVLTRYAAETIVSDEDYKKFENNEITIDDLINNRSENIEYGESEYLYEDSYLDEDEPYEFDFVEEV